MQGIQIGGAYSFIPEAFIGERTGTLPGRKELPRRVTGRIIYINEMHRYFTVSYEVNGYRLCESIKF